MIYFSLFRKDSANNLDSYYLFSVTIIFHQSLLLSAMIFSFANLILGLLVGFAALDAVSACPYAAAAKIKQAVQHKMKRQVSSDLTSSNKQPDDNAELIGDLLTGMTTSVGKNIGAQLLNKKSSESNVTIPANKWPTNCTGSKDPCCSWYLVSKELTTLFLGAGAQCNNNARAAIRLGFHDAGTWNRTKTNGGADGSFLTNQEWTRSENTGLEGIARIMLRLSVKYNVGKADVIQFAAKHAVATCPLGPRIRTYVGRIDSPAGLQADISLLPGVSQSPDDLIALFNAKTITPHMLAALLGAHSTSKQFNQDPARAGAPQDTTPGIWDVKFYNETLPTSDPKGVFKFASDVALSTHPQIRDEWNGFIDDQEHWNEDYAHAYLRLSLLGVNNINNLVECTTALP